MKFKEKHPDILKRYEAFWSGGEADRPVMYMAFPNERSESVAPPEYAEPIDRLKPEIMVARARHKLATTDYFAEGFPHWFVNYGPGVLHACITGGDLHIARVLVGMPGHTQVPRHTRVAQAPQDNGQRMTIPRGRLLLDRPSDRPLEELPHIARRSG